MYAAADSGHFCVNSVGFMGSAIRQNLQHSSSHAGKFFMVKGGIQTLASSHQ